jgi:hypothetical protein
MPRKLRACEEITAGIPFDFAHGKLVTSVRLSSFAALIFCLLFHQGKSKSIADACFGGGGGKNQNRQKQTAKPLIICTVTVL